MKLIEIKFWSLEKDLQHALLMFYIQITEYQDFEKAWNCVVEKQDA